MRTLVAKSAITILMSYGAFAGANASEPNNFVKIALPKTVSVEIPRNWVVLSENQSITLDSAVDSHLDLAGKEYGFSTLPFAANLYGEGGKTIGMINVRYYPNLDVTQGDVNSSTDKDVTALDDALKNQLSESIKSVGLTVTSWRGTQLMNINGNATFVTEYQRSSRLNSGQFTVRLVRVFAGDQSFTLTVSYHDSAAYLLKPITDRIIHTLSWVPK